MEFNENTMPTQIEHFMNSTNAYMPRQALPSTHAHTHANENKQIERDDLYVVTLQIVLEEKEKKKTKTCGVFLDSACGCCKKWTK